MRRRLPRRRRWIFRQALRAGKSVVGYARRALWAVLIALSGALSTPIAASMQADAPTVPRLSQRITDQAEVLSAPRRASLEAALREFETQTGAQLAVLIVESTQPETIEQFSIRVVDEWQLGRTGVDDGALLLVALKDRVVRIEVGRGLEGALTDLTSRRIIDESIVPQFRAGDYAGGVEVGLERMMQVVRGEPLPPPDQGWQDGAKGAQERGSSVVELWVLGVVAIIWMAELLGRRIGRMPAALTVGSVVFGLLMLLGWALLFSLLLAVLSTAASLFVQMLPNDLKSSVGGTSRSARYRSDGSWGGYGGGFRGGSGGGFGGLGGGFGGGGASGRW
jgi:uncharacterized protein